MRHFPSPLTHLRTQADVAVVPFLHRFSILLPHYRGFDLLGEGVDADRLRTLLETVRGLKAFQDTTESDDFYIKVYSAYAGERGRSSLSE